MTKKIALALVLILMLGSLTVLAAEESNKTQDQSKDVVAVVNGEEITATRLDQEIDLQSFLMQLYQSNQEFMQLLLNTESGKKVLDEYRKQKLDQYVTKVLMMQEAEKRDLKISQEVKDQFFNQQITQIMENNNMNKEQLKQVLKKQGINSMDEYKEMLLKQGRDYLLMQQLQNQVLGNIEVTEEEINKYYEENRAQFEQKEAAHLYHILADSKENGEKLLAKLEEGADFNKVAIDSSKGPKASEGGDVGFVPKGQIMKELDEAAFNLEIGQVSDLIKTDMGYHIIKVVERREAGKVPLNDVKEKVVNLIKSQKKQANWNKLMEDLKEKATVDIRL